MTDLVIASSSTDLLQQLRTIDISVPPRTEGRTTEQREQWSICRLLATYAETDLLDYPLQVKHKDRPDIILSMPSVCVGIEITEAVPENLARSDVQALKNKPWRCPDQHWGRYISYSLLARRGTPHNYTDQDDSR